MRIHGSQDDIANAFFNCQEYPCESSNMFHQGDTLYSYGRHFWLAIRHKNKETGITYLLNGDYFSSTTRRHQSIAQQQAPGDALTLSGEALKAAGIDPRRMQIRDREKDTTCNFHAPAEVDEDDWSSWKRAALNAARKFKMNMPSGATLFSSTHENPDNPEELVRLPHYYHRPASALLFRPRQPAQRWVAEVGSGYSGHYEDYNKPGAYYILGMDDDQYFISELPGRPQTVEAAFETLKPQSVKDAERDDKKILRQGEWFFIQEINQGKEARALYRKMKMKLDLTNQSGGLGASHTATRGNIAGALKLKGFKRKAILVSGHICHSSHEHPMLTLSYAQHPEIWQAACNTAKNSWSMGGNVD